MNNIQNVMSRMQEIQSKFSQFIRPNKLNPSAFEPDKQQLSPVFKTRIENEIQKNNKDTSEKLQNNIQREVHLTSKKYSVPESLINAIIKNESNYNPLAISPKGAQGLMQLMPNTAAELGVKNPFDISQNIEGGVKYLSQLLNRYDGDFVKAISAYNAGPARVINETNEMPDFKETKTYVKKVILSYLKNMGVE